MNGSERQRKQKRKRKQKRQTTKKDERNDISKTPK